MRPADGSYARIVLSAIALVGLIGVLCYSNSLAGEFVFDDLNSIRDNATIRSLFSWAVLFPPSDTTTASRPVLNLSLALNFAVGGEDVFGYHLANVIIHILNAVVLFALVQGTLSLPFISSAYRSAATGIGLAAALIWVAHPLTTEAVSYVVQRCESMAALCTLLMLFCLLRCSHWERRARRWYAPASRHPSLVRRYQEAGQEASKYSCLAVICCVLGVLTKETMGVAPVVALLYDRTFLSGSFREALRRRGITYVGLFSTWVLLGFLVYFAGGRAGTVGFGTSVPPWRYASAQAGWILHYLRLCVWPRPLVFDYGVEVVPWDSTTAVCCLAVAILLLLAIVVAVHRPTIGFLLIVPMILLTPTSGIIPVASQVAAERRMYLPAAALVVLGVVAIYRALTKLPFSSRIVRILSLLLVAAAVVPLGVLTHLRNEDYRTGLALWADTVAQVPDNARAQSNYGRALLDAGRYAEAVGPLETAVRLAPEHNLTRSTLGVALLRQGRIADGIICFRTALARTPNDPKAMINLAAALQLGGGMEEAVKWYRAAVEAAPGNAEAHFCLGLALAATGRLEEARACMQTAVALDPQFTSRLGPHP